MVMLAIVCGSSSSSSSSSRSSSSSVGCTKVCTFESHVGVCLGSGASHSHPFQHKLVPNKHSADKHRHTQTHRDRHTDTHRHAHTHRGSLLPQPCSNSSNPLPHTPCPRTSRSSMLRDATPGPANSTAWLRTSSLLKAPHSVTITSLPVTPGLSAPCSSTAGSCCYTVGRGKGSACQLVCVCVCACVCVCVCVCVSRLCLSVAVSASICMCFSLQSTQLCPCHTNFPSCSPLAPPRFGDIADLWQQAAPATTSALLPRCRPRLFEQPVCRGTRAPRTCGGAATAADYL